MEELKAAKTEAEETYNKRPNRKITDLPLDTSQMLKLPDEIIIKLLRRKLSLNICRNRGYILDGWPKNYKAAVGLWFDVAEEAEAAEGEQQPKILGEILPNSVIRIDGCDEGELKERMKRIRDVDGDENLVRRRFERRLREYRDWNESEKGEPNLTDFFRENQVEILGVDGRLTDTALLQKCKVFLERNGPILNYQNFDEIREKLIKEKEEKKVGEKFKAKDSELLEDEFYDLEKEKVKESYNKSKAADLDTHEKEMLEKKSEVLRRYLAENIIPVLSKGILHVCKNLPEDPVDALAFYLFDNAFNAKFPPHKYKDQK